MSVGLDVSQMIMWLSLMTRRGVQLISYLLLIVGAMVPLTVMAADMVVVVSGQAKPYHEANRAVRQQLRDEQVKVYTITLKQFTHNDAATQKVEQADSIIAIGTPAALAIHGREDLKSRMAYCMVSHMAGAKFTEAGSFYGVTTVVPLDVQVKWIKRVLPKARHVGMLHDAKDASGRKLVEQLRATLPDGWKLTAVDVNRYQGIAAAIDALFDANVDVVWTQPDAKLYRMATVKALLLASLRQRVPVFGFSNQFVKAGALCGVAVMPKDQGQQVAQMAIEKLKQATKAAERMQPAKPRYKTAINLVVAERLNVKIPSVTVEQADLVHDSRK